MSFELLLNVIILRYKNPMTISYGTDKKIKIQKILCIDNINQNNNPDDLRLAVRNGFPFSVFEAVQKEIGLT